MQEDPALGLPEPLSSQRERDSGRMPPITSIMRPINWIKAFHILAWTGLIQGALAFADSTNLDKEYPETEEVKAIIAAASPPVGVLFNVLEYDEEALEWMVPRIKHYVALLRKRYPELPIVVVSHGDEMFALQSSEEGLYGDVHRQVRHLVEELGVTFHVCGTYARANGVDAGDFPRYVDVVPLATSQISDYRELGYRVITTELSW
jgi:intracellular sulfur oxidation DsrE/DsrF family protein